MLIKRTLERVLCEPYLGWILEVQLALAYIHIKLDPEG